ncbi:cupin [Fusarium proliferatum]|uniref:Cupin n=1 Tax=Gibberella intermedia TaxID=948311 RepID=A0A365MWF5_GIBIN|nr:cupin [Fusarium proliferatum]
MLAAAGFARKGFGLATPLQSGNLLPQGKSVNNLTSSLPTKPCSDTAVMTEPGVTAEPDASETIAAAAPFNEAGSLTPSGRVLPSASQPFTELQGTAEPQPMTAPQTAAEASETQAGDMTPDNDLTQQLMAADLSANRFDSLTKDEQFVFDFYKPLNSDDKKSIVPANRRSFPALVSTGSGMAVGRIGPCGLNLPHVHPRSSELQIVTQGRLMTETVFENGRLVRNELGPYQMTPFYQGLLHAQFNPDCTDAMFVSSFPSEDFGTISVVDSTGLFSDSVIEATFGQSVTRENIDNLRQRLSPGVVIGVQECLKRCKVGNGGADAE